MLSDRDLAFVATELQVPLIVTDILDGRGELSGEDHYGLHDMISDLHPDSALLAIAISARKIARVYQTASPAIQVLVMECDRIIDEYGDLWIQNAQDQSINEGDIYNILVHTAEDLEGLAELLELNSDFLEAKDGQAAVLCDILSIQAKAQALVAEELIETVATAATKQAPKMPSIPAAIALDNVIPFPGEAHQP